MRKQKEKALKELEETKAKIGQIESVLAVKENVFSRVLLVAETKCKQFITRRRVLWAHLPLLGRTTRRSRVVEDPTVVNEPTIPFFE